MRKEIKYDFLVNFCRINSFHSNFYGSKILQYTVYVMSVVISFNCHFVIFIMENKKMTVKALIVILLASS
jgi:hypothetical protein